MAKISISSPCHHIHRIILPPDSQHLIHHPFIGGALVMAKILWKLRDPGTPPPALWDKKIRQIEQSRFPDRFIHISRFCPAPVLRKLLTPDQMFLRVSRTEDGENFDGEVQYGPFEIRGGRQNVFVIGGSPSSEHWPKKLQDKDICYLIPKSFDEAIACRDYIRQRNGVCPIICQIDISNLTKAFPIQKDTSYERTVGEICRAKSVLGKKQDELIKYVSHPLFFSHLIVRIGNSACVLISSPPEKPAGKKGAAGEEPKATFFYHPQRSAPTRFPALGDMLAYDLLMATCMADQLNQCAGPDDLRTGLENGARVAVQASYACFLKGFGQVEAKELVTLDFFQKEVTAEALFHRFVDEALAVEGLSSKRAPKNTTPAKECPVDYAKAISPNIFWRMAIPVGKKSDLEKDCLEIALDYLLNREKKLPLVNIGDLHLVDRHEVEDYLFLQNLLLDYHGDSHRKKPLCVGVFGQPGSGKSFGVKQLVAEMSGDGGTFAKESITVNLSQMRTLGELTESFHRIRDACLSTPIPLVFFDEFDSSLDGKSFGWLKYFLAPMQDGEFIENGKAYHFGKAIFVFAGGVNHSFSEFNERSRNPDFCDAKGPDFISRLRGILNIRGMNRPEGDEIEYIYMLRRAVFLKEKLEKRMPDKTKPLIKRELAEALLQIHWFKHGVRSMEAILDMSRHQPGETFSVGHLPPRDQLDMHVDARAFRALVGIGSTKAV